MLTLYQFEISPFCDKIRRVLHLKGLDYQVRDISLLETLTALRKISPTGKVPCLDYHGTHLVDSTNIAHFLEQKHPDPPLVPRDPRLRGLCHILEDWADESLYFYEMSLRFTRPHNAKRWVPAVAALDPAVIRLAAPYLVPSHMRAILVKQGVGKKPPEMILEDVERHLAALEGWLGQGPYLLGDALSLADLAVFAQLNCIRGADEGARLLAQRPPLAAWMERVDRASCRATQAGRAVGI